MLKLWNITGHLNTVPSATSVIEQKDICPTDGRRLLSISCFPSVILPEENVFSQETLMALQRSSFFFLFLDFNFSKWRNCSVKVYSIFWEAPTRCAVVPGRTRHELDTREWYWSNKRLYVLTNGRVMRCRYSFEWKYSKMLRYRYLLPSAVKNLSENGIIFN